MLNLDWQIVWTFLNLIVLYLLLKKFLFKPVTEMMESRTKEITDSIKEAEDKNLEADALKKSYEAQLLEADQEASKIVKDARERASKEYDKILDAAQADARRALEDAQLQIEAERKAAMQSVRENISGIVLLTAAKVAQKNLDEDSNREFVDSFLAEAGGVK